MYMPLPIAALLFGGNDVIGWIVQIVFLGFFVVFMFYGQRFQMMVMLREVETHLRRLKLIRDDGPRGLTNFWST